LAQRIKGKDLSHHMQVAKKKEGFRGAHPLNPNPKEIF
jgi:hypothetical protein